MDINSNDLSELSKLKIELETTKRDLEIAESEASVAKDVLGKIQKICLDLEKHLGKDKYKKTDLEGIVLNYLQTIYILAYIYGSLEG